MYGSNRPQLLARWYVLFWSLWRKWWWIHWFWRISLRRNLFYSKCVDFPKDSILRNRCQKSSIIRNFDFENKIKDDSLPVICNNNGNLEVYGIQTNEPSDTTTNVPTYQCGSPQMQVIVDLTDITNTTPSELPDTAEPRNISIPTPILVQYVLYMTHARVWDWGVRV